MMIKPLVWLLLPAVLRRTTMPTTVSYNYLIAEYGSLSQQQRNVSYVKKAAQAFVRSLAAYPANKNGVADRNAFTFGHDAQLNFNTSFTGKDKLNFRLRANTIYSFAKRVNAPFADLAFDGSLPENWKGKRRSLSTSCTTSSQLVLGQDGGGYTGSSGFLYHPWLDVQQGLPA